MIARDDLPRLTPYEFRLLRDLIYDYCGIYFQDDAGFLIQRRLAPRLEATGCRSFAEYYEILRYHNKRPEELEEIAQRITTNETYFFREGYQLDALRHEILPEAHAQRRRGRRLMIWSAGCATGEEAYTLAILVLESGLFRDWEVRIFGNDISRRVLQIARKAVYGHHSFRQTEERYLRRYFRDVDGRHQVKDEVKSLVTFGQLNLMDAESLALVGEVDIVLCRNVLIYFDVAARRRAIDSFHRRLVPGGYLLLGHSESLLNLSTAFELVHLQHDMVYRKPQG
jgi:chemotaxis protein methyltransferase CheR